MEGCKNQRKKGSKKGMNLASKGSKLERQEVDLLNWDKKRTLRGGWKEGRNKRDY